MKIIQMMERMPHRKFMLMAIFLIPNLLITCLAINAQQVIQSNQVYTNTSRYDHQPCITKEKQEELKNILLENRKKLKAEDKLFSNPPQSLAVTQTFAWPLTYNSNFYDNDYYYIQNYIDHDANTGSLLEYNCGDRTYDKPSGYNHSGTDICIGPYHWSMMDSMFVHVIAAAPGQIVGKDDFHFDRNCGFGAGDPNYITIEHSDGSFAKYSHLKSGSVTSKGIGDMVDEGEYLGLVGSSGNSTNPHLHFEVLDQSINVIDPWAGPCNPDISSSLWKNQLPYYNPGILRLMTLSGPVPSSNCPDPEFLTIKNHFSQSEIVRFELHLRDLVPGLTATLTVTNNTGNQLVSVNFTNTGSFSASGFYHYNILLPAGSATGTYKMSVSYSGKSAVHYFTVGCPGAYNLSASQSGKKGYLSGSSITSTSVISSSSSTNVWYEAENFIQVNPGFKASAGCTFTARINDCTSGGAREAGDTKNELSTGSTLSARPSVANHESTIEFDLPAEDKISIDVYDLTGRKITSLLNGKTFIKGIHQLVCNTTSFINGLYLIKMTGLQSENSCKLIVHH